MTDPTKTYAEISRTGRFWYDVVLVDPTRKYSRDTPKWQWCLTGWSCFGYRHAASVARRRLRRYNKAQRWTQTPTRLDLS